MKYYKIPFNSIIPSLHYSITPLFHHSNLPDETVAQLPIVISTEGPAPFAGRNPILDSFEGILL
ncbi:MAG: hypothetical protein ACYC6P_07995 [Ignavibacteriaceae bacterium]